MVPQTHAIIVIESCNRSLTPTDDEIREAQESLTACLQWRLSANGPAKDAGLRCRRGRGEPKLKLVSRAYLANDAVAYPLLLSLLLTYVAVRSLTCPAFRLRRQKRQLRV